MMKVLFVCLALLSVAYAKLKWNELDTNYKFETYLQHFNKKYDDATEYEMRKTIFESNLHKIVDHNKDSSKTWKEEVNHLADWTPEEFKRIRGYNKKMAVNTKQTRVPHKPIKPVSSLPDSVDWRTKGVVTPVKDQGECGSCWSFAAAETVESHWAISKGQLWELSEQQILDCTSNPQHCGGTGGCGGGTAEVAFTSIIKAGGLSSEWTYPYESHTGVNNPKCLFNSTSPLSPVSISSFVDLPQNEYLPLLSAVATVGPVAISVDAGAWQFYASGVFNGCNQTNPDLDHAVQLVGYGTEEGKLFWLVRNSWTPSWGEGGYIKIMRSEKVECGTDSTPSDGSGCEGGPSKITVCGTCGILYDNSYPVV